jgi:transcriptional regulator with XRE-family HTH domain
MSEVSIENLSVRKIKAARALLGWNQYDLANESGISYATIARLEKSGNGMLAGLASTHHAIRAAFAKAGIEFLPRGVRQIDT